MITEKQQREIDEQNNKMNSQQERIAELELIVKKLLASNLVAQSN